MFLSVFEMFKVGLGPSSSHTMGPMTAAARFLDLLREEGLSPARLRATLHGSLAHTGKGHATDRATVLGLMGFRPDTYERESAESALRDLRARGTLRPDGLPEMGFDPDADVRFDKERTLDGHANGMAIAALDADGGVLVSQIYYSIGGGFVLTDAELSQGADADCGPPVPYPFKSGAEMMRLAQENGCSVADLKRANELTRMSGDDLDEGLARLAQEMSECIDRGLSATGSLPGGLRVRRRAGALYDSLMRERGNNAPLPHSGIEWLHAYAMAVNEENASGGRIVTAPTNGAAGVLPAVLRYWLDHLGGPRERIPDFLLTAAAIGGLVKHNASISGAECGCQAEVGSAAAMAAAALCAVRGGSPMQVEEAAEIALEHHLGMTCDPIAGLVQIPCIERNGLGAVKAVSAASLALRGDGVHVVPLDACIETMRQTGRDMMEKYKETSLGGLAVNVPNC